MLGSRWLSLLCYPVCLPKSYSRGTVTFASVSVVKTLRFPVLLTKRDVMSFVVANFVVSVMWKV